MFVVGYRRFLSLASIYKLLRIEVFPPSSLFDFVESVPDLRVRRIRGPHFILQARPEASLKAIQDFVGLITSQPHGPV